MSEEQKVLRTATLCILNDDHGGIIVSNRENGFTLGINATQDGLLVISPPMSGLRPAIMDDRMGFEFYKPEPALPEQPEEQD